MKTYSAVRTLWILTLALSVGAAWFAFKGTTTTELMQVTHDVPTVITPTTPGTTPLFTPGRSTPVAFNCSTVWDRWVNKAPAQASDGTTYAALTETRTSDNYNQRWYGNVDKVLDTANSSCQGAEQGRLHLFWTLLAPAALLLVASEVLRRSVV